MTTVDVVSKCQKRDKQTNKSCTIHVWFKSYKYKYKRKYKYKYRWHRAAKSKRGTNNPTSHVWLKGTIGWPQQRPACLFSCFSTLLSSPCLSTCFQTVFLSVFKLFFLLVFKVSDIFWYWYGSFCFVTFFFNLPNVWQWLFLQYSNLTKKTWGGCVIVKVSGRMLGNVW